MACVVFSSADDQGIKNDDVGHGKKSHQTRADFGCYRGAAFSDVEETIKGADTLSAA